jgi:mutator family transposase
VRRLDAEPDKFARRRLEEPYPYLILDARYVKMRETVPVRSQAVGGHRQLEGAAQCTCRGTSQPGKSASYAQLRAEANPGGWYVSGATLIPLLTADQLSNYSYRLEFPNIEARKVFLDSRNSE